MFLEVKAYKCQFCGRLFADNHHHRLCKDDPDIQHCGDCKHHYHATPTPSFYEDDPWIGSPHMCRKHHPNWIPRKKNCPDYELSDEMRKMADDWPTL